MASSIDRPPPEARADYLANRPSYGMVRREPATVGKVMRWLQTHGDGGALRAAYVQLTYQTAEHAAEEKSPTQLDMWDVDMSLDDSGRRTRFQEIADLAWQSAQEFMQTARIRHVWKLIRVNEEGQHVGMLPFALDAEYGSSPDGDGADPPNDRGAYAAVLRSFTGGSAIHHQAALAYERMALERNAEDRRELRELRENNLRMMAMTQEALDRKAEREIKAEEAKFALEMKKEIAGAIKGGVEVILAKHAPVPKLFKEAIDDISQEQWLAISQHLNEDQKQKLVPLLRSIAEAKERDQTLAARAAEKAADKAAKDEG